MRLAPFAAIAAACALSLTACGGDDGSDKGSESKSSETSQAAPTENSLSVPTDTPSQGGKGATVPVDKFCKALDAAAVGDILGGSVKRTDLPGTGCTFTSTDPGVQLSAAVTGVQLASVGGLDAFKSSLAAIGGGAEPEEVPDVGDGGFVAVSEGPAGATSIGGLVVGDNALQVLATPGADVSADDAKADAVELLKLLDAAI